MCLKKSLGITLISLLSMVSAANAALPSDAFWEVRTTGNDDNGGCYDFGGSGTDYSQQDSAQLTLSDLATSGAGSTTLTSATGGFTSAMVDNCIQIKSGTNFDVGFYEITAYTNTNTVTLDRTPSAAGAGSSGVGSVGGALLTLQKAENDALSGNVVWIKAGTYAEMVTQDEAGGSTWIGYNSTRGDDPTGTNRPLITGSGSRNYAWDTTVADSWFYNLRFESAVLDGFRTQVRAYFVNVKFASNGNNGFGSRDFSNVRDFFFCEFSNNTDNGISNQGGSASTGGIYYSNSHDNGDAAYVSSGGLEYYYSIADTNGAAQGFDEVTIAIGNIAYNNTGAGTDGFAFRSNDARLAVNNVATDNADYGFTGVSGNKINDLITFNWNAYQGNTTGGIQYVTAGAADVTSAPSFTDEAGADFTAANSSSPLIGAGFPRAAATGMNGTWNENIGIDQDDHAAGGGATTSAFTYIQ